MRIRAFFGSVAFFLAAPAMVAGVIPWGLTGWEMRPAWTAGGAAGVLLAGAGLLFLLHSFWRFVSEGMGTPAPIAPTEHLVVGGVYRHVRNPMYLAVLAIIVGQWLVFGHDGLLVYAAMVCAAFVIFVRTYEEPTLAARYGAEYDAYRRAVPGWLPRLTPWTGGGAESGR